MPMSDWHVLIVEDETDSREVVQSILEHHKVDCFHATTAEEALVILEDVIPTLIIIDLALPGMDGWQLLATIKTMAHIAYVPRVAITAYHHLELAEQAIEAGFDAYFPKPIEATSFVRELTVVVNGG